jgi:hypothetical protein
MATVGATVVEETDVTLSGTTPIRLDPSPTPNRFWVRVVNPSATLRVFIAHTPGNLNVTNCETADPVWGTWEDGIGPGVQVWARTENGSPITVRVKQYAL